MRCRVDESLDTKQKPNQMGLLDWKYELFPNSRISYLVSCSPHNIATPNLLSGFHLSPTQCAKRIISCLPKDSSLRWVFSLFSLRWKWGRFYSPEQHLNFKFYLLFGVHSGFHGENIEKRWQRKRNRITNVHINTHRVSGWLIIVMP